MSETWSYHDVSYARHGTMQCTACGTPITEGEYRCRQKFKRGDWKYVTQHRGCTPEDPSWGERDERREESIEKHKALSRACREFREKWGVEELDDYIIEGDGSDE